MYAKNYLRLKDANPDLRELYFQKNALTACSLSGSSSVCKYLPYKIKPVNKEEFERNGLFSYAVR